MNEREYCKRIETREEIVKLFPKEDPVEALKRELQLLKIENYIETAKDIRFSNKTEMGVFGKEYNCEDIYIKIRVELLSTTHALGDNYVMIMSFHYSDRDFEEKNFPYKKDR